ncbi:MAG: hypothetical protein KDB58_07235 [Solirubrobacterales bacterium]|nr:hypothetical protein [Solirubrobacterales bacterium]MCB8970286.1 hypothetical protein [Thermoleophilales bacterium]MCB9617784.1 hypothetical protein [Sandaracinus sp.]
MADREEICRRHRLPARLALELHGETPDEWEADAAARAAVAQLLGGELADEEPEPVDDLDLSEVTDEQLADEQTRREGARIEADEQEGQALIAALFAPKPGEAELIRSLHGGDEES